MEWLTVRQAADISGIDIKKFRNIIDRNYVISRKIPCGKTNHHEIELDSLKQYCKSKGIKLKKQNSRKPNLCSMCKKPAVNFAGKLIPGAKKCAICAYKLARAGVVSGTKLPDNYKLKSAILNMEGDFTNVDISCSGVAQYHIVAYFTREMTMQGLIEATGKNAVHNAKVMRVTEKGKAFLRDKINANVSEQANVK